MVRRASAPEVQVQLPTDVCNVFITFFIYIDDLQSYLVHRADLQQELLRLATSPDLPGVPANLHFGSAVKSCDVAQNILQFKDGRTHTADLIIGTDGIYVIFCSLLLIFANVFVPSL